MQQPYCCDYLTVNKKIGKIGGTTDHPYKY